MARISLEDSVKAIKGVGDKTCTAFSRAGIQTIGDLILCFPRNFRSGKIYPLSSERCGSWCGFYLTALSSPGVFTMAGGRRVLRYKACDENGTIVHIMYINQPYLKHQIAKGDCAYYFGILQEKSGGLYLFSPEKRAEAPDPEKLYPVYSAVGGLSSKKIEKLVEACLVQVLPQIRETLPQAILDRFGLMPRARAIFCLHAPPSKELWEEAKKRFAFEELFDFSVKATIFSRRQQKGRTTPFHSVDLSPFLSALPFSLTDAQKRVLDEITADLVGKGPIPPMNRLVQGDVGSGKTVVAAAAAYLTAQNGKSTLVMAPTEILARQHFSSFEKLFRGTDIPVFCLTGSTSKKEREAIFAETMGEKPYVLVGTHALVEEGAKCQGVALAITDEQHRFGVRHRNLLGEKGGAVHSLVMSATPIPRSLAMFLYAKGKISIIDQLPPGRQVIDTLYVGEDKLSRVYGFLRERVQLGQQAYVVCPLIEDEEEKSPLQSATEEYDAIQKALPDIPCALLHGKMKPKEKNEVMEAFQAGKTKILVSTTVIEVGVDVPNATVMVIRSAERFGLSQLHQLRGRVGRGTEKSYCVLISSHSGKNARERLKKLCDCHDGFELAKYDLKTRGPGEFFGTRQSGFGGIDLGDAMTMELLKEASEAAELFIAEATPEEMIPFERGTRLN